ncbi:MAG TPA: efflux RND transporter periplasmic adaptor subunit [Steroidobacteraceae bacterium]|nr:efflux RND transporter periplasmic adaptor subunit [Steroidobacteraceae bacterium]
MKWRAAAIAVGVIGIGVAAMAWFGRPKPVEVETVEVTRGKVDQTVTNTRAGTVKACQRAKLAPPMGGQIARLPVKKGDHVERGQVLLELWNDDIRAELQLARKDAAATRALRDQACISAKVARRESDRLASLVERKLVSVELADRAAGEAEAGEAACRAAGEQVLVSQARIDAASARLERTLLRAPFAGIVAEINGEVGEFVTPSPVGIATPPAVDVVDSSCIYITAPIDEVDAPRVRPGMPARVTLDAFKDRSFRAHVRRVAPYVLELEKQARTVEVEAEIEDRDDALLLPGYSADLEVILAERPDVLRVPTRALIEGNRVFVLEGGRVHERKVTTGIGNWEYTEVTQGLAAGDRVVVSIDREGLKDGAEAVAK